jgi:hypothetical protein
MIMAFTEVFVVLCARDYQPALNIMDNECSKAVEKQIRSNRMDIQLVLPHNHRVNAIEWTIATFKEHFVATLATMDMLCPLQLWDRLLPQVKLTLNLLRFCCWDPKVSANQELYGAFNYNKMPLAPLGTKALVFDDPTTQASWAPHTTDDFYIGPANDHYWCLCIYIPATLQSISWTHGAYILHIANFRSHRSKINPSPLPLISSLNSGRLSQQLPARS